MLLGLIRIRFLSDPVDSFRISIRIYYFIESRIRIRVNPNRIRNPGYLAGGSFFIRHPSIATTHKQARRQDFFLWTSPPLNENWRRVSVNSDGKIK